MALALAGFAGTGALRAASFSVADPAPRKVASVVSEEADGVILTLNAGEVAWTEGSGYVYPSVKGFGLTTREGSPALPIRIERVAIPAGSEPRLTILEAENGPAEPGRVGPVQRWVPIVSGSEDRIPVTYEDPAVYGSDDYYPADEPVRLGETGSLREQAYVDVIFTPVLARPGGGASIVYRSVKVRIDFGTVAAIDTSAGERDLDGVYESAFVNARQAKGFVPSTGTARTEPEARFEFAPLVGATKYKLTINRDGIYRLDVPWVTANAPGLLQSGSAKYRIDCQGQTIPITVTDANMDGTLNGTDTIEFYGQALSWDLLSPDDWNSGDFTDDNIYWLYADTVNGLRATTRVGNPVSGYTIPLDFSDTAHHEVGNRFLGQVPQDQIDHWYEDPPLNANGAPVNQAITVATPGVSTDTTTASIKVRMLGDNYINNLHRTTIKVNGATVSGPSDWDGWIEFTQGQTDGPANFNQSVLNDGTPETTTVTVSLPLGRMNGATPITHDVVYENWIEITYGRKFRVDTDQDGDGAITDDQMLTFSVPNVNSRIHITGFGANNASIYEITKLLGSTPLANPVRITGAQLTGASAPYSFDFQFSADGTLPPGTKRRFAVATITATTTTGDLVPAAAKTDVPSTLASPSNGADWLVIANDTLLDGTANSPWQNLLTRRANQGLRVKVVSVEDVYDEFSWGIQDPEAIRNFIAYAYANWQRIDPNIPLRYVLMVGDGSFDYKNGNGNLQNQNLLSTYMRSVSGSTILGYMSDETYFSTVSGADPLPDVYLGRWPVHSAIETDAVAQKILTYEQSPPAGVWQGTTTFVADDADIVFEQVQDQQANDYLFPPYTYHKIYELEIKLAHPTWNQTQVANEVRDRIIRSINGNTPDPSRDIGSGTAVLSYVGHGSWQNWGDNASFVQTNSFTADDVDALTANLNKFPLMLVADCLSGGFAVTSKPGGTDLSYALGDDYLTTAQKGAIGVLAPSHLTFSTGHTTVLNTFFGEVFGPKKTRGFGLINQAIQLELKNIGDTVTLRSYTLIGDPYTNLVTPAPKPPTNVIATPGNRQVTITWTASAEATSYNVYQATSPNGAYTKLATVPSSPYVSQNLTNCTQYYYMVTSVDAAGYEGTRSQFNDGCGTGGTCVTATPTNPSAPSAPTGVTAVDNEIGGSVRVSWTANLATNEVYEYKVYWGTSPGVYPPGQVIAAGTATTQVIYGLTNGVTYYFAVSGTNCSHGEGAKSASVSGVPHRIEGIKPPNGIDTLRVFRSVDTGDHIDDIRLQWTAPTTNVYSQPTTIASQEIYSGTTPNFTIDAAHKIATVSGATSTYIHENAFGDASRHYYEIVAVDSNGLRSAVRDELPAGIDQVTVQRSGGNLVISWPAVTLDMDGHRTTIAKYTLYGRSTKFYRSDVGPALLVQDNIATNSVTIPMPAGTTFYYSVIATDNRGSQSPW